MTEKQNKKNEKILIVGPAWVGDMVMAQSLFKLIKQRQPEAQIDVLAPAWSQPLLERMPEVHRGIVSPLGHGEFDLKTRKSLGRSLRDQGYTQSIMCTNSWKSALVPYFAKIPKRTSWRGEWRYGLLNDVRTFDKQEYPLMVQRFMMLAFPKGEEQVVEKVPVPKLICQPETVQAALQKYQLDTMDTPVLAICPGAEFGPSKRWPENYYAEVANKRLEQGWQVWIFGSKKDQEVASVIQQQTQQRCIDLTGKTTLPEAIDLMSQADAVVSNDSGLMHIAAALSKPLVVPYGSSSPDFTPPLSEQVKILRLGLDCSPCFKRECPLQHQRCMKELSPKKVLEALDAL
ncbi:MAG: lipopolysaccharide heptosyltransferase II [Coxiellaceae bacterium]|nr:lipopolysaccharide heptosyltransferase II [Coxiellaceae bacterium]